MLISDIIGEVIQEVGQDTADSTLDSLFLTFMKGALRRAVLFTKDKGFQTTSSVTLTSGTQSATLPTGFLNEIQVYRVSSNMRYVIDLAPDLNYIITTDTTGTPFYYRIIGSTIFFDKKANSDMTIYIEHYKELDSVAGTDTFGYKSTVAEVIKDGMKYTYYSDYVEDAQKAQEKLALFKAGLDQLEELLLPQEHGGHIGDE